MRKGCWGLILGVSGSLVFIQLASAQEDASAAPVTVNANEKVLENWQAQSGQSGSISPEGGLEWHGEVTTDVYNVDTSQNDDNAALTGLYEGDFALTRLQGDLRTPADQAGNVNYIQGALSVTNDRAVQSKYTTIINNMQAGRAGNGYQIAVGDVVADFSKIGSNLGLRGLYGAKQISALTLFGYAGTVADSWEAMFNRPTINNQPARSRFLRDVAGFKADYKLNEQWSVFGTAQTFTDRKLSIVDELRAAQIGQSGSTGTAGLGYKTSQASFSVEAGTSRNTFDVAGKNAYGDEALLIDAAYAWQTVYITAGHHNIGARYVALSSNLAPGVRESFVNGNWSVTPNLSYNTDVRRTDSRNANLFNNDIAVSKTYGFTNGLNYNVSQIPGLNFSLQDRRNWNEAQDARTRNTGTDFSTSYANQHYNGNLIFSNARQRSSNNPESNSITDGVRLAVGRQVLAGELIALPSVTGSISANVGYQQQRIANGTKTSNASQGINLNAQSQKIGIFSIGVLNTDTRQPNGRPLLNTKTINLDWNKNVTEALLMKAYIHNNYRNHGDETQRVDEKIIGLQIDYQW